MANKMTLPKSSVVDFNSVPGPFGMDGNDDSMLLYGGESLWQQAKSEDTIEDLQPLFEKENISLALPDSECWMVGSRLRDDEYDLENFGLADLNTAPVHSEPIECVVVNVAHLEQFPKPASPYSATLPCIFAWIDAHNAFSSEFPTTVQNYFKLKYSMMRQHLRFFFSIAPSLERLGNLSAVRRDVAAGRVLFHYIGHGFPTITKESIWCSERRSREFVPFPLATLFEKLQPPTWFLFDCSNAAVVLDQFKETARRLSAMDNPEQVDWNDWMCICATGEGEELPDDPRLPRDFLTSTILSPIQMAVICHMLQFYRMILFSSPSFPLEAPCQHLWSDKSSESKELSNALAAITDAIAADSLPQELYQKLFKTDRSCGTLFRHFLLAQYLLRPYRVHPVSYPEIPDLSMHDMWRQWSILLDSAICSTSVPKPVLATDLFSRAATSFEVLMHSDQFDMIRPFHLILLFHMLFCDASNDQPVMFLSEYAADPRCSHDMLVSSTVFHPLFAKLLTKDPKSPVFYPLCYLVLVLLYDNPDFANDISRDLDASSFPSIVFMKDVQIQTRTVCAALVAHLVVSHETFQKVCTSEEYLGQIAAELLDCDPSLQCFLLLIIRRAFNFYSPDMTLFTTNGLHLKCAICADSYCPLVRAAGVAALTCFMSPFECLYNSQLFFMALKGISDGSYLVRFHLVLLLKKFLNFFDNFAYAGTDLQGFSNKSFKALFDSVVEGNADESFFSRIDALMKQSNVKSFSYSAALYLLTMYSKDPHPAVRSLASKIIKFTARRSAAIEGIDESNPSTPSSLSKSLNTDHYIVSYGDDEFEEEHCTFANLDQNDALHRIAMRLLANINGAKPTVVKKQNLSATDLHVSEEPLVFVEFIPDTNSVVAASSKCVYFIHGGQVTKYKSEDEICDVQPVVLSGAPHILFTTTNGSAFLWNTWKETPDMAVRADSRFEGYGQLFVRAVDNARFATIQNDGVLCIWNLAHDKLEKEHTLSLPSRVRLFELKNNKAIIACTAGEVVIFDLATETSRIVTHSGRIDGFFVSADTISCYTETGKWQTLKDTTWTDISESEAPTSGCRFLHGTKSSLFYANSSIPDSSISCDAHPSSAFLVYGTSKGHVIVCEK